MENRHLWCIQYIKAIFSGYQKEKSERISLILEGSIKSIKRGTKELIIHGRLTAGSLLESYSIEKSLVQEECDARLPKLERLL